MDMVNWLQANWVQICAGVWAFDQLLKVVAKLTPSKLDDNLSDMLGNFIAKFMPKK